MYIIIDATEDLLGWGDPPAATGSALRVIVCTV